MGGKARFVASLDVLPLSIAAQRDAGKLVPALAQLAHQVVAAAVRQSEIADQQVEGVLVGQFQGRGHVSGTLDRVAIRGQHHPHHFRRDAVVFDQQDVQGADGAPRGRGGRQAFGLTRGRGQRQADAERRALVPALAVGFDRPPCISTSALLIANPKPKPPNCRVIERSACSKALKIRDSASGSIPIPLSFTSTTTYSLIRPAADADAPAVRRELDRVLQ